MTSSESQVRFSSHTLDKATKAKVIYRNSQIKKLHSVLRIRIRWIRKILASWIRIRKNMRIQGAKYQPKTKKKTFSLSKPKSELLKKERL